MHQFATHDHKNKIVYLHEIFNFIKKIVTANKLNMDNWMNIVKDLIRTCKIL